VVFGSGNVEARVLIVCEAPDHNDDAEGHIMSGPTGELVDMFLDGVKATRDDVFLSYMVMCRPTKADAPNVTRTPTAEEVKACRERLDRVIDIVDPLVILLLGKVAFKTLTDSKKTITRVARDPTIPLFWASNMGTCIPVKRSAFATFHPMVLLRQYQDDGEAAFFRPGGDAQLAYYAFSKAFQVSDMHHHLNTGADIPVRSTDD